MEKYIVEKNKGVCTITINSPQTLNSLNTEMLLELHRIIDSLNHNEISALVFTANGKAFVAGADITEMAHMNSIQAKQFASIGSSLFDKIESLPFPTIAAINGYALGGGCELALACDIRIASDNAKIGLPEVSLGITPGFGGTVRLTKLVGKAIATELICTASIIDAKKAHEMRLVNHVVSSDELLQKANDIANLISSKAPIAVKLAKESINNAINTDIGNAIRFENSMFSICFSTEDQKNGMEAFIKKEKVNFNNR